MLLPHPPLRLPPGFLILVLGSPRDETVGDVGPGAHGRPAAPRGKAEHLGLSCFHVSLCPRLIPCVVTKKDVLKIATGAVDPDGPLLPGGLCPMMNDCGVTGSPGSCCAQPLSSL